MTREAISVPKAAKSPAVILGVAKFVDASLIVLTALVSFWSRHGLQEIPGRYWLAVFICALVAFQVFHMVGLYQFPILSRLTLQVTKLTTAWLVVSLSLIALIFFSKTAEEFSRLWAGTWLVSAYICLCFSRAAFKLRLRSWRQQGKLVRRVAVIGAGDYGERLLDYLKSNADTESVEIVGVYDDRGSRVPHNDVAGYPILGDTDDLIQRCRTDEVDLVIVALPWSAETRLVTIMNKIRQVPVDLQLAPERVGFHLFDRQFTNLAGLPMLSVFERPLSGWSYILKALEDRVLSFLILVLISPLMLFIAIAVKLDSPGPILFRQQRYGFNNNVISVWKFRTMFHESATAAKDLEEEDAPASEVRQASRDDARVTTLGRFLRRTSLDELPQFFNVLQGSMSIVGPRPHAVAHNPQFAQSVAEYYARHRVKPGITGWAQINGFRGETDTQDKLEMRV